MSRFKDITEHIRRRRLEPTPAISLRTWPQSESEKTSSSTCLSGQKGSFHLDCMVSPSLGYAA